MKIKLLLNVFVLFFRGKVERKFASTSASVKDSFVFRRRHKLEPKSQRGYQLKVGLFGAKAMAAAVKSLPFFPGAAPPVRMPISRMKISCDTF